MPSFVIFGFAAASVSTSVRDVSGPPIEDKTGTEITRAQFARLVERLEPAPQRAIRGMLAGLQVERDGTLDPMKRLVFDDGKQQLWRLIPGGRALERKYVSFRA